MKVAVAQFSAGRDAGANLGHITALAEEAARSGARLVVFPEGAMHSFGGPGEDLSPFAEALDGRFVDHLRRLASRVEATLVAGMLESIPGEHLVYNTAVIVDPRDGLVATHRKRHLYDAFEERESDRMRPGVEPLPLVDVDGFKTAIGVCYELRFPAFIQDAADRGAELLAIPSAWVAGPLKEEHWVITTRARAIENTMYVAAAGMSGAGYCARSMLIDPLGVVLVGLGEAEGVTSGEITKERLAVARRRLPLIEQRRSTSRVAPA
jgi:predicted amidohydrolase